MTQQNGVPGPIQVLLIEDNAGDVRLIEEMLSGALHFPCELEYSNTLSGGLDLIRNKEFGAVLLDIGLPDSSGLESIREIRSLKPGPPIVILTGLDDEEAAVSSLKLGAQDYLIKGQIDSVLLTRSLRYAIERWRVESELLRHREYLMELVEERTKEIQWSNESLQAANELLENVFANVHVLIAYMDKDFNFIKVNTRYAESDGRAPAFFIGKNHFDLYSNEENEAIFRNVVETGKPYFVRAKPFTYPHNTERGTTFWDWSLKPVIDAEGKTLGLILSLIDVTDNIMLYGELMRAEHLASIGRLAAGVAHEINNPINGVINYAQILSNRSEQGSSEKDIAGRIIKESDRIAGIVSSLLSFARDNRGAKAPVSVRQILDDALSLTGTQLKKQGIKINIDFPPDLPGIYANRQQIEQILLNMISNARYALKQRYPADHNNKIIEISGAIIMKEDVPYVRVIFYDNGAGIPPEILNRITDPFFSTKPEGEGTGLGLSISHGIVMGHKGSLKIESREGEFTRVIIDLPASR